MNPDPDPGQGPAPTGGGGGGGGGGSGGGGLTPRASDEAGGDEIVIHVCDEDRGVKEDFRCRRHLLLKHMAYFRSFIGESSGPAAAAERVAISVHCDVRVFAWLMRYVHSAEAPPPLDAASVISILISSDFLQMAPLTALCLRFMARNLSDVLRVPIDMSCIRDELLVRLASLTPPETLALARDRRDKLLSRLYKKRIELDFRERKRSAAHTISACRHCFTPFSTRSAARLRCPVAPLCVAHDGACAAHHAPAAGWSLTRFVGALRAADVRWEQIYWYLWALVHPFRCERCGDAFAGPDLLSCNAARPEEPFDPALPDAAAAARRRSAGAGAEAGAAHLLRRGAGGGAAARLLRLKQTVICDAALRRKVERAAREALAQADAAAPWAKGARQAPSLPLRPPRQGIRPGRRKSAGERAATPPPRRGRARRAFARSASEGEAPARAAGSGSAAFADAPTGRSTPRAADHPASPASPAHRAAPADPASASRGGFCAAASPFLWAADADGGAADVDAEVEGAPRVSLGRAVRRVAAASAAAGALAQGLSLRPDPDGRRAAIFTALPASWIAPPAGRPSGGALHWMCAAGTNVLGAQPRAYNAQLAAASASRQGRDFQRHWIVDLVREQDHRRMMDLGRALRSRRAPADGRAAAGLGRVNPAAA